MTEKQALDLGSIYHAVAPAVQAGAQAVAAHAPQLALAAGVGHLAQNTGLKALRTAIPGLPARIAGHFSRLGQQGNEVRPWVKEFAGPLVGHDTMTELTSAPNIIGQSGARQAVAGPIGQTAADRGGRGGFFDIQQRAAMDGSQPIPIRNRLGWKIQQLTQTPGRILDWATTRPVAGTAHELAARQIGDARFRRGMGAVKGLGITAAAMSGDPMALAAGGAVVANEARRLIAGTPMATAAIEASRARNFVSGLQGQPRTLGQRALGLAADIGISPTFGEIGRMAHAAGGTMRQYGGELRDTLVHQPDVERAARDFLAGRLGVEPGLAGRIAHGVAQTKDIVNQVPDVIDGAPQAWRDIKGIARDVGHVTGLHREPPRIHPGVALGLGAGGAVVGASMASNSNRLTSQSLPDYDLRYQKSSTLIKEALDRNHEEEAWALARIEIAAERALTGYHGDREKRAFNITIPVDPRGDYTQTPSPFPEDFRGRAMTQLRAAIQGDLGMLAICRYLRGRPMTDLSPLDLLVLQDAMGRSLIRRRS